MQVLLSCTLQPSPSQLTLGREVCCPTAIRVDAQSGLVLEGGATPRHGRFEGHCHDSPFPAALSLPHPSPALSPLDCAHCKSQPPWAAQQCVACSPTQSWR